MCFFWCSELFQCILGIKFCRFQGYFQICFAQYINCTFGEINILCQNRLKKNVEQNYPTFCIIAPSSGDLSDVTLLFVLTTTFVPNVLPNMRENDQTLGRRWRWHFTQNALLLFETLHVSLWKTASFIGQIHISWSNVPWTRLLVHDLVYVIRVMVTS